MVTQFLSSIKSFYNGSLFDRFISKKRPRPLSDDDEEDDNRILDSTFRRPPLKRSRLFDDDPVRRDTGRCVRIPDWTSSITQHRKSVLVSPLSEINQMEPKEEKTSFRRNFLDYKGSSYKRSSSSLQSPKATEQDIEYLGTSTNIATPIPSDYIARIRQGGAEGDNDYQSPAVSSFRFSPTITSTISRKMTPPAISITKRSPIHTSRTEKILGLCKGGVQKRPSEISRYSTTRSYANVFAPITMKRFFSTKSTPMQVFRLEEKEKYRQLIQQQTTHDVTDLMKPSLFNMSLYSPPSQTSILPKTSAIMKKYLDPVGTYKTRDQLEKKEKEPTSSLPLSSYLSPKFKPDSNGGTSSNPIPVIDLELEGDDDIVITKVIKPPRRARNSLEPKLAEFYSDDWLYNFSKTHNEEKENQRKNDMKENETELKRCEERSKQCLEKLEEQVMKRILELNIEYPKSVTEVSEEEEEEFPELIPQMMSDIERAFKGPAGEVLVEKFNIQITRRDIHTLSGLNWLNDEVINFYMNMLMERGQNDNYPSVYAFNTFFYSKLVKMGYASVKRWTKKVDIFSYNLLLVPVHLGMHWCLATVDFREKCIRYYDSMHADNYKCLEELRKYLDSEHQDKKKSSFNSSLSIDNVKDIPQQMNGSDCGMFSCKFAEYLSRNANITFTQEHMPYFRKRMVYEIITAKLL